MGANWTETSQMTIRELADFSTNLAQTLQDNPAFQTKRSSVEEAFSAQCIQCQIRVPGADLLKVGETDSASPPLESDPKLERLRMGYCARNGCDSQFYNVTCSPHPQVDWPALLNAHQTAGAAEAASATTTEKAQRFARHHRRFLRTAVAIGALLLVYVIRQIYLGGTIPLIRQPEQFQVDRQPAEIATPSPR